MPYADRAARMSETELNALIRSGNVSGGFLFYGGEDYTKTDAVRRMTAAVTSGDEFAELNTLRIYGDAFDAGELADALATPPSFAERRLVVARDLPTDRLLNKSYESELNALYRALSELPGTPSTVFVLCMSAGAFDADDAGKRAKLNAFFTKLCGLLVPVEFARPDEARLRRWIARHFSADGIAVTDEAASELLYLTSRSMFVLAGEIEKLTAFVLSGAGASGGLTVTAADVREVCCRGLDEEAFALSNALAAGDRERAFEAVRRMKLRRESPVLICASVARTFVNMLEVSELTSGGMTAAAAAAKLNINPAAASIAARNARGFTRERLYALTAAANKADALLKSANLGYVPVDRLLCAVFSGA